VSKIEKKINIIYFLPADNNPIGGIKTILRQSNLINKLNLKNIKSQIVFFKFKKNKNLFLRLLQIKHEYKKKMILKKNFIPDWCDYEVDCKNDLNFNSKKDFLVFPEVFADQAYDLYLKKKIKYAIYVQNGYYLLSNQNTEILKEVYKNASFIISYTKEVDRYIYATFPFCKKKILRTHISFLSLKIKKKKNLITYMPRKLPDHSRHLINIIKNRIPKKWTIKPLNNFSETEILKNFISSKIFLSFSHLESVGFPPIEAAIHGNKVIGYSGHFGETFWKKPIFTRINYGDLILFSDEVINSIKNINLNWIKKTSKYRNFLKKKYSLEEEIKYLKKNIAEIIKIF